MSDAYPQEQAPPLTDPLRDAQKFKVYFDTARSPDDRERRAIVDEVAAYYQSLSSGQPAGEVDVASPSYPGKHGSSSDGQATLPTTVDSSPTYSIIDDLKKDGYVPVEPSLVAEYQPRLRAKVRQFGDPSDMQSYFAMAREMGESEAVSAAMELQTIAETHPEWMKSPSLRKRVVALNTIVDHALLRLYTRL